MWSAANVSVSNTETLAADYINMYAYTFGTFKQKIDFYSMNKLESTRVVLLACGCYNPPTIMHLRMFEAARDFLESRHRCNVVEGIMSPVADCFGKPELVAAKHRYQMAMLATNTSAWIHADSWECSQKQWTRTLVVLRHFKKVVDMKYRDTRTRLMLLCGGDFVDSFQKITPSGNPLWSPEDISAIINEFGLVVLSRESARPLETLKKLGYENSLLSNIFLFEDNVLPNNISSTRLRAALRRGESIKYCTDDTVVDYIRKNELYKAPPIYNSTPGSH